MYRARDTRLDRIVALKLFPDKPGQAGWGMLLREARVASSLNHPNVATIFDAGEDQGTAYIAMEYAEGLSLKDIIHDNPLHQEMLRYYALQVAEALAHAHQKGVVHGDLKASNVIVTPEGTVKLVDFGLARKYEQDEVRDASSSNLSPTDLGPIGGTLTHASPEILAGNPPSIASDIWAFGVLLYEMATGNLPFRGKTAFEIAAAVMTAQYDPLPERVLPPARRIIEQCLLKDPAQRYERMTEIVDELKEAGAAPTLPPKQEPQGKRRAILAVAGILVLASGLVVAMPSVRRALFQASESAAPPRPQEAGMAAPDQGNPDAVVWVNLKTGVYHCPDTRWYGKTLEGKYLPQKQARETGFKPAEGKACK